MKKIIKKLRSRYSAIDTYIILGVIGLALGVFGYFMVVEIEGTVKFLGALLGFLYMVFIVSHLFLAFPLFVIAIIVSEFVEENAILPNSIILLRIVQTICLLVVYFVVYLCVPVLSAMMLNGSFDLSEALDFIHEINHGNK